jgi:Domain of unknown function (DUF4214)
MRLLTIAVSIVLATTAVIFELGITPAMAMNGNVPDNRSATPVGEITAYYWHGLNRDPDPGGLNNYLSFANSDCRWGIQDAGIKILDSAEAHNAWHNNTQTFVGMLYSALLNRPPDPGGFNTYVNAINSHGLRWAITAMQASAEFHNRLAAICNGRPQSNATAWDSYNGMLQAIQINNGASDLVYACGVGILVNSFGKLTLLKDAARLIKLSATAAYKATKVAGGACTGAYQMLQAADDAASIADYGGANNPVFLQSDTRTYWNALGHWCETWIRIGPNAMTWNGYKADYRC